MFGRVLALFVMLLITGCHIDIDISGTNPTLSSRERYTENLTRIVDGIGVERVVAQTSNGNIGVTGTTNGVVRVQIRKVVRAPSLLEAEAYAREVQIFVEKKGSAVYVRKEHPRFPKEVLVEVSYDILCPARLDVNLRTSNGNIEIQDMEAVTQVKTTNGNVQFRGNPGYLEIKTSNGNIRASVIQLRDVAQFETTNGRVAVVVHSGIAPISAVTTNGSIDVTLPADFSGKLEARTVNGRAQSVFDIPRPTGSRQNRLSGTLGSGGDTLVQLRAVNGNVNLWKLQ